MSRPALLSAPLILLHAAALAVPAFAQDPGGRPPGGPGGMNQTIAVLERFDTDKNKRLDADERKAARAWLEDNRPQRGRRGPGMGGPFGGPPDEAGRADDGRKGAAVGPTDVPTYADRPLFDPDVVRTFFFEFAQPDWFAELSDFYRTDVEVPAKVTVDGTTLHDVGVRFRGNTSYMMAPGHKKSLDLDFAFVDAHQDLAGVHNLDLLNCNSDPSFLREALHGHIANQYFPAQRVCLARVVINGEDHGLYAAVQQFDKEFLQDHFATGKGDRFKVPPDFSGSGGLAWLGDDVTAYKHSYQLKSTESDAAWQGLVDLCEVLERTPTADLERILPQHLDVDTALWFLAVDNALGDDDGYSSRASDYLLYRDPTGRFHPIPRDNNEILPDGRGPGGGPGRGGPGGFRGGDRRGAPGAGAPDAGGPPDGGPGFGPPGGGPGFGPPGGGRRGGPGSAATSPLQMASRTDRPLLHRLLEVPAWRQRYLANLHELA
ncbi:MAG TPA: CotH kinase family protein, partial [Planctomycetota bacterium]|nr:CotH kinase family protein [Planctomycetota bacterium]